MTKSTKPKSAPAGTRARKPYKKPTIRTEKVLEAGLAGGCNGSTGGGRKVSTASGCTAGKLLT